MPSFRPRAGGPSLRICAAVVSPAHAWVGNLPVPSLLRTGGAIMGDRPRIEDVPRYITAAMDELTAAERAIPRARFVGAALICTGIAAASLFGAFGTAATVVKLVGPAVYLICFGAIAIGVRSLLIYSADRDLANHHRQQIAEVAARWQRIQTPLLTPEAYPIGADVRIPIAAEAPAPPLTGEIRIRAKGNEDDTATRR